MPCFYAPNLNKDSVKLTISGDENHHIIHVFRKSQNDEILLTNGSGLIAKAIIKTISRRNLTVLIQSIQEVTTSNPKIAVAFSLLKNKHDAVIIEKLTELGVKEFFPIITQRSVRKTSSNTVEKFKKIAISAIKQCDNAFLPKIHQVLSLKTFLDSRKYYQLVVALETGKHKTITKLLPKIDKPVCVVIGPEGGFDKSEIEMFKQKEIPAFTLGNHILRAETSAIAAASQVLGYFLSKDPEYY